MLGWDITCDKHLVLGNFKHGFGRLDLIKDDPTLTFEGRMKQAMAEAVENGTLAAAQALNEEEQPAGKRSKKAKKESRPPPGFSLLKSLIK